MTRILVQALHVVFPLTLLAACTGSNGGGGTPDGGDAASPESVSLWIGEANPMSGECDMAKAKPLAGALVAADLPGGQRVELETQADGRVKLDGIDWTKGRLSVTVWASGYTVISGTGIDKAVITEALVGGVVPRCLTKTAAPTMVDVTGSAKSMADPGHSYIVSSAVSPGPMTNVGTDAYALPVWAGVPGTIVACEFTQVGQGRSLTQQTFGWTRATHPALTSTATVDLDFSTKLPVSKASGKLKLPADPNSTLRKSAFGYLNLTTFESGSQGAFAGLVTSSAPSASGDFIEYTAEFVNVPELGTPVTLYALRVGMAPQSIVWRTGLPKDGEVVDDFLDTFTVVRPKGSAPFHGDIELASSNAREGVARVLIVTNAQGERVWVANDWDSGPTFRLPELPSKATALAAGSYTALPALAATPDARFGYMRMVVTGATIKLTL